jgi:hypothetical protein
MPEALLGLLEATYLKSGERGTIGDSSKRESGYSRRSETARDDSTPKPTEN